MNYKLNFLKKNYAEVSLIFILLAVVLFSLVTLTTKPRLWVDEAKSIELSHSFLESNKLDIQIAPGEFSEIPQLLQSTGYPVTVLLSLIFKIFGYGLEQARLYMLGWSLLALALVFWLGKKLFGPTEAILATVLISSFASFYDSGRTVVGEIPGFIFLLLGIYFWLLKDSYYWAGIFWGLAVVAKPSVFGLIIPAIFFVLLLEKQKFLERILKIGLGMLPAAFLWILFVLPNPFSIDNWQSIANFYKNPYSVESLGGNVIRNLLNAPFSTTLIYFGILFLLLVWARFQEKEEKLKSFYNFIIIYGAFAFIYYLRSPGWLRYILIGELLILFALPQIIHSPLFLKRGATKHLVILLCLIQFVHLFTAADIFYSEAIIKTGKLLNEKFPQKSIGIVNDLRLSILLKHHNKYQMVKMAGIPIMGEEVIFNGLPGVLVISGEEEAQEAYKNFIQKYYQFSSELNGYKIYLLSV